MTSSGPPLSTRIAVRARSPVGVGLTGKAVEALALCLFITVLPRTLGPEDFGRLALAVAVVQIAGASMSSGGPVTLSRFVPAQRGADRAAVARLLVGRMARWRLALLAAAAVIAAAFSLAVPERVPPGWQRSCWPRSPLTARRPSWPRRAWASGGGRCGATACRSRRPCSWSRRSPWCCPSARRARRRR